MRIARSGKTLAPAVLWALFACAAVVATSVREKKVFGDGGLGVTRVYTYGHYKFGWKPPPLWNENLNPGNGLALRLNPQDTNAVVFSIAIMPVSLAEKRIEAWRAKDFKKEISEDRIFAFEGEAYSPIDDVNGWTVWGTETTRMEGTNAADAVLFYYEKHSYHISKGYLIHMWLRAPRHMADRYVKDFDASRWRFYTYVDGDFQ